MMMMVVMIMMMMNMMMMMMMMMMMNIMMWNAKYLPSTNEVVERSCFYTYLSFCQRGGGLSRPRPRGVSRPRPGGVVCPGGCPGPGPGGRGVSQHALTQTPPSRRQLLRTVRILLECIIVYLIRT